MAIDRFDINREGKAAKKELSKLGRMPDLRSLRDPSQMVIVQGQNRVRRGRWVLLGSVLMLAIYGGVKWVQDVASNSEGISANARQLCDDIPSVGGLIEDGCTIHVPSIVKVKPRNPDVAEGVEGTIEFVLSAETKAGKLMRGNGIGLSVPTDVIPSDNYADAFVSISDPNGQNVGAQELFAGYGQIVAAGGDAADNALEKCREEMDNLMTVVQSNAEFFATDTFTVEAIRTAVQRVDYAPYTSVPYPDDDHLEIIFTENGGELICPEPVSAA